MKYLFDTSSLIQFLEHELRWQEVQELLESQQGYISFVSSTEIYYRYKPFLSEDRRKRYEIFLQIPLYIIWPNQSFLEKAGFLKAEYGLGLGDAFVAASADLNRLTLVHRDQDFLPLKHIKQKYLR